jgi:DnaK suppressor protein
VPARDVELGSGHGPRDTTVAPQARTNDEIERRKERTPVTSIDTGEMKKRLEEERTRLSDAVDFLEKDNAGSLEDELGEIGSGGTDNHLADTASATYDRELEEGLEEGAQQTLSEVEAALGRIADGSYGVCEICGKPIGAERLSAIPWARFCIDDQRRLG